MIGYQKISLEFFLTKLKRSAKIAITYVAKMYFSVVIEVSKQVQIGL